MSFTGILSIALGAILVENFILVQFLGICPFMGVSRKMDTALGMGIAVIFVMALASIFCYLVNLILVPLHLEFLQTLAFVLIIASLVQFVEMFLQKAIPSLYEALGIYLPLITTNCAVLGAAQLNAESGRGILASTVYGTCTGIGFALALVLFSSLRERLELSRIPKAFQGVSIALITAGILAMGFMGFSGLIR